MRAGALLVCGVHALCSIHTLQAHALITRLPGVMATTTTFPALILLVSGGHNMLVYTKGVGQHRIIGRCGARRNHRYDRARYARVGHE
eukprot:354277-Chlamydomonas_euryale.AAC.2